MSLLPSLGKRGNVIPTSFLQSTYKMNILYSTYINDRNTGHYQVQLGDVFNILDLWLTHMAN